MRRFSKILLVVALFGVALAQLITTMVSLTRAVATERPGEFDRPYRISVFLPEPEQTRNGFP